MTGTGSITYSTSGVNPTGNIYLTNVTINGANDAAVISGATAGSARSTFCSAS